MPEPREAIHNYFSLSYANWLCLPRTLLQSMPDEWQAQFVALVEAYDEHWRDLPGDYLPSRYTVMPVGARGRFESWDCYRLPHYSRGRTRVAPDGTRLDRSFP